VRIKWCWDGLLFVTAGYDNAARVYGCVDQALSLSLVGGTLLLICHQTCSPTGGADHTWRCIKQLDFTGTVEAVEWIKVSVLHVLHIEGS